MNQSLTKTSSKEKGQSVQTCQQGRQPVPAKPWANCKVEIVQPEQAVQSLLLKFSVSSSSLQQQHLSVYFLFSYLLSSFFSVLFVVMNLVMSEDNFEHAFAVLPSSVEKRSTVKNRRQWAKPRLKPH